MRWRKMIYPIPLGRWNSYIFTRKNRLEDITSVFTVKQSRNILLRITHTRAHQLYYHLDEIDNITLLYVGDVSFFNYIERMYRSISQSQLPRITNETNKTEFDCNWNVFFSLLLMRHRRTSAAVSCIGDLLRLAMQWWMRISVKF